uniref:SLC3A2_N domain-containing protein n=1 Tax=Steinernema glaseri TaxID=37863 RepID=A0A1I7Z1F6_9BILA
MACFNLSKKLIVSLPRTAKQRSPLDDDSGTERPLPARKRNKSKSSEFAGTWLLRGDDDSSKKLLKNQATVFRVEMQNAGERTGPPHTSPVFLSLPVFLISVLWSFIALESSNRIERLDSCVRELSNRTGPTVGVRRFVLATFLGSMSAEESFIPSPESVNLLQPCDVESGEAESAKDTGNVNAQTSTIQIGLTKEQLEKYRRDPFWRRMRCIAFVMFWTVWCAMIGGSIAIVSVNNCL